jgi:hypothetical protein
MRKFDTVSTPVRGGTIVEHWHDGVLVETSFVKSFDLDALWLEVARESGSEDGPGFRERAGRKWRRKR